MHGHAFLLCMHVVSIRLPYLLERSSGAILILCQFILDTICWVCFSVDPAVHVAMISCYSSSLVKAEAEYQTSIV